MNEKDRKFKSQVNENECLIIETPDYIKAMPLKFPGSGLMVIYNDSRFHHYDIYDENKKHDRVYLKGYSDAGDLFVSSGQNVFKIKPEIEKIEMVPRDEIPILNYFMASGNLYVDANAEGYVVYVKKEDR